MRVSQDVLQVLDRGRAEGGVFYLPPGQLDRKLYEAVNKALVCAGGKWDRRAQGHVFDGEAEAAVEPILLTGEITDAKQEFGAFYTPAPLAAEVIRQAEIGPDMLVLEPSCGEGALVGPAVAAGAFVEAFEIRDAAAQKVRLAWPDDCSVAVADFLTITPHRGYERIVMNPPFAKLADAKHVLHAERFLAPGGRLVAIMGAGVLFRQDALYVQVRDLVQARGGSITPLPEGAFKSSGTGVNTVLVVLPAESV